jgi:hypothetical protein
MPKKGELMDGRVGSWSNAEMIEYLTTDHRYNIVANEWDPFPRDKLVLSGRNLQGTTQSNSFLQGSPRLLFVTTLRDPADRLLSSYTFFGVTGKDDDPEFGQWMKNNLGRVKNYKVGSKAAFRSNIARVNHSVWRFSGGELLHLAAAENKESEPGRAVRASQFPPPVTDEKLWKAPFEDAVRALTQQDLVLPMDAMTEDEGKAAMQQLLGWTQFGIKGRRYAGDKESGHVVTKGEVKNSNAREYLGDEYRALWEANWLDYVLFYWSRAVFFARLHCNDVIDDETLR